MAADPTSPVIGDSDDDRALVPAEYSKGRGALSPLMTLATVDDEDVARPAGTQERPLWTRNAGTGVDREVVVSTYRVTTAFAGASIGDTLTATRVLDVSGSSASQVGATAWYNETTAAALGGAPAAANIALTGSGTATETTLTSVLAALNVPIPGIQATGSLGALNANVELVLGGAAGFVVDLRGTFSATVTFQGTIDGTNWFPVAVLPAGGSVNVATVTTATAAGAWAGSASGFLRVRAIATAYTSGTANVVIRAVQNASINLTMPSGATSQTVAVGSALPAGANTIGAVNIAASQTLATVTTVGSAQLSAPVAIADITSAAITSTATTSAIAFSFGASYKVVIPVTAVSGTNPTMDVSVEESLDGGTNWFKVYDFPRITSTGIYSSPKLPQTGNRVRFVQTLGGTTPSFTRAINRLQSSDPVPALRQLIDRAIVLTGLNSTAALDAAECNNAQLIIELGTATTPPAIQIEGSDSLGGTGQWYALGPALTGVASSTVQVTVNNIQSNRIRARVTTIGNTIGAGYAITLKGF